MLRIRSPGLQAWGRCGCPSHGHMPPEAVRGRAIAASLLLKPCAVQTACARGAQWASLVCIQDMEGLQSPVGHVRDRFPAGSSVGSREGAVSRDAAGPAGLDAPVGIFSSLETEFAPPPPGDSARERKLWWLGCVVCTPRRPGVLRPCARPLRPLPAPTQHCSFKGLLLLVLAIALVFKAFIFVTAHWECLRT